MKMLMSMKHYNVKKYNLDPSYIGCALVCIAKKEEKYIEEFVQYHLKLGVDYIFLYDNEDVPTYRNLLSTYKQVYVNHLPGKHFFGGPQTKALEHFTTTIMKDPRITHVAHIDIDEFIVLKKHSHIHDFIRSYIKTNDNSIKCAGIGMNWRFFGSSGHTIYENIPMTIRFTKCAKKLNHHIKTLFNKDFFQKYNECHSIQTNHSEYSILSTSGKIINGPFNEETENDVIQLNHYKCKTFEEFKEIRKRGRADIPERVETPQQIEDSFRVHNINEIEDKFAYNFFNK